MSTATATTVSPALRVRKAAAVKHFAAQRALVAICGFSRRPSGLLRRGLHDGRIAGRGEVPQPELHGIGIRRRSDFVDELLAPEMHFGARGIAHVRGAQGRRPIQQRRNHFPRQQFCVESVALRRRAETGAGIQIHSETHARESIPGIRLVEADVDARKTLGDELVGNDLA